MAPASQWLRVGACGHALDNALALDIEIVPAVTGIALSKSAGEREAREAADLPAVRLGPRNVADELGARAGVIAGDPDRSVVEAVGNARGAADAVDVELVACKVGLRIAGEGIADDEELQALGDVAVTR